MNLATTKWENLDFETFRNYLLTLKNNEEKITWRKNIVRTKMEMLAIYSKDLKLISKEISKSSYSTEYLENTNFKYYEETLIYGDVLSSLKDFDLFEKYLNLLALKTENWSTCDNLKFDNMYKLDKERLFNISLTYLKDNLTYKRRIGLMILFTFINDEKHLNQIYEIIDNLKDEKEYYVNMAASWLLCEMVIKQREKTLKFYKDHQTNKFVINTSIQKCRDSFRVSSDDKNYLLRFKVR